MQFNKLEDFELLHNFNILNVKKYIFPKYIVCIRLFIRVLVHISIYINTYICIHIIK
jgi:hypothetical protein